ncbi:MAG: amidohydrolase [Deltaproteobacteria bacterium]|jgi:aminobenzoyl-glutamate utilization protein A|nr:amidohydrolase [Deltaproteobacteria bacterium]
MDDAVTRKVKELEQSIVECRRDLHKYPETGWTEFRTAAVAIKKLESFGYAIKMGAETNKAAEMQGVPDEDTLEACQQRAVAQGGDPGLISAMTGGLTGFIAEMTFDHTGPRVGYRVDMDANDITESADEAHRPFREGFSSVNSGAMHACGHDAHVAIGLGVAEVIASMKSKLKGSLRLIFQPAEEGVRGAKAMVAAGVTQGINFLIGSHVSFQADRSGVLICGAKGFLASTKWDVTFTGKSAHAGAAPQDGKNALLAACVASLNLHAIARHADGVTRINVGKLVAGEGRNVIPAKALLIMETRGLTTELDEYMLKESGRIIEAAARMYDCAYEVKIAGGSISGESDAGMLEVICAAAKDVPFYKDIIKIKEFGGGEDFSYMLKDVQDQGGQGTYIQVGVDRTAGHHNERFDLDEAGMLPAVELLARSISRLLSA